VYARVLVQRVCKCNLQYDPQEVTWIRAYVGVLVLRRNFCLHKITIITFSILFFTTSMNTN